LFPVQSWYFKSQVRAARAHATLLEAGIWTVLVPQATENPTRAAIRFVVTAAHAGPTMARALEAIRAVRRKVTAW
jgi:7-keto-8-aminopelargonate synthetase-like enzyme